MIGFARRTFMVPLPEAPDIDALNGRLLERCLARRAAVLRGTKATIAERLLADQSAFLDLPAAPFEPCDMRPGRASSQALVRYRNVDYSVPVACAHREVVVKGYVSTVVIPAGAAEIARHRRSYEPADFVFDPLPYLALLERKVGALDQAAPLQGWDLPKEFATLRRLLEACLSSRNRCAAGKREYVQVLRLMEAFPMAVVHGAVRDALRLGALGYDAIRHLVLCRIERRPPKLDLDLSPYCRRSRWGGPRRPAPWRCSGAAHDDGGDRGAGDPAAPPPQEAQAADGAARAREARPPLRRRERRSCPLPPGWSSWSCSTARRG